MRVDDSLNLKNSKPSCFPDTFKLQKNFKEHEKTKSQKKEKKFVKKRTNDNLILYTRLKPYL